MRDYRDAKAIAHSLRQALARKGVTLTHAECLELTARGLGAKDWNVLSALIQSGEASSAPPTPPPWSGPLVAMRDLVMFPKQTVPLFIGRERSRQALSQAFRGELEVLLVAQRQEADEQPSLDALYGVGVIADVLQRQGLPDGTVKLVVRGRQRAALLDLTDDGYLMARAALIQPRKPDPQAAATQVPPALEAFTAYALGRNMLSDAAWSWLPDIAEPGALADIIAQHAPASVAQKQAVLEVPDGLDRLEQALRLLPGPEARAA